MTQQEIINAINNLRSKIIPVEPSNNPSNPSDITSVAQNIFSWFVFLVGFLTILVIIYAGIMYITAAGEEEKQASAKKTLQYAIIGFIILTLAYLIVRVLINIL